MNERENLTDGIRYLFIAAALVVVIWGINQAQSALASSIVAVFLSALCIPAVQWLKRKRVPQAAAVLLVLAGLVSLLLAAGGLVASSLGGFNDSLPSYQQRIQQQAGALTVLLTDKGLPVTEKMLLDYLNPAAVMKLFSDLLGGLGSVASNLVLILLTVMFILLEASSFPVKLRAILGDPRRGFHGFSKFARDLQRYVVVATALNLAAGSLIGLWLALLGVGAPVLWGFLAFMLLYIPHVGSIIAAIPAVSLALVQFGPGRAGLVLAGYVVIAFTIGNVIQPKLVGYKLNLSTLVVFLSLIFWGRLLGLLGAALCIPFTLALKFACKNHESTRWIAVLLGPEAPARKAAVASK